MITFNVFGIVHLTRFYVFLSIAPDYDKTRALPKALSQVLCFLVAGVAGCAILR